VKYVSCHVAFWEVGDIVQKMLVILRVQWYGYVLHVDGDRILSRASGKLICDH
jgi:hypothetical protein